MFFHVAIFSGSSYNEKSESKKKGRPRVEVQDLRIIPVSRAIKYTFWPLMMELGIVGLFLPFVNGVKGLSELFPTVVFGGRTSHRGLCVSDLIANSF